VADGSSDDAELASSVEVIVALRNQLDRVGVERLLQQLDVIRRYSFHEDLLEAIEAVVQAREAILLVALHEIDESASAALRATSAVGLRTVIMVDELDPTDLGRLRGISVSGLLATSELTVGCLNHALQSIRRGHVHISSRLMQILIGCENPVQDVKPPSDGIRITAREREVLDMFAEGLGNKEIGRRLAISENGVKRYVAIILAKLSCSNRTMAVAKALQMGLISSSHRPRDRLRHPSG
jgi:DNA-binding NarL/FixJ family response regulator